MTTKKSATKAKKVVYIVNLSRVPAFCHEAILTQMAKDEGISIEEFKANMRSN
jgi:hypothetical protein